MTATEGTPVMKTTTTPRTGRCASCEGELTGLPVWRLDETYCCGGCADGGPCVCLYEPDLASDGVDGLGLPFLVDERIAIPAVRD
jgi:hypothetical protein